MTSDDHRGEELPERDERVGVANCATQSTIFTSIVKSAISAPLCSLSALACGLARTGTPLSLLARLGRDLTDAMTPTDLRPPTRALATRAYSLFRFFASALRFSPLFLLLFFAFSWPLCSATRAASSARCFFRSIRSFARRLPPPEHAT